MLWTLKKLLPCLEGRNMSLTSAFIGRLQDNCKLNFSDKRVLRQIDGMVSLKE